MNSDFQQCIDRPPVIVVGAGFHFLSVASGNGCGDWKVANTRGRQVQILVKDISSHD